MKIPLRLGLRNTSELLVNIPVISGIRRRELTTTQADIKNNYSRSETKTIDEEEIRNFDNLAKRWWNEHGEFKALHSLNKLRVPFVRDGLISAGKIHKNTAMSGTPLKGMKIIDIGCGGGILSEPLARIGADVVGLDASRESIAAAKVHANRMINSPTYVCETIEEHANTHSNAYDAVVLSEVLEHIQSKDVCLQLCSAMLKPRGSIFITTVNKTISSWLVAILAAEWLLRVLPQNTHQWDKFISPLEVQSKLRHCGCNTRLIHGMYYDILCNKWHWISDTSVNFALHAVKQYEEKTEDIN